VLTILTCVAVGVLLLEICLERVAPLAPGMEFYFSAGQSFFFWRGR